MSEPSANRRGPDWREHARIVARAWADPDFAELLRSEPVRALAAEGIEVPEGTVVVDVDNEAARDERSAYYFVLPPKPVALGTDIRVDVLQRALLSQQIMYTCSSHDSGSCGPVDSHSSDCEG